ncbi:ABC transporter ATP-binding protein [Thermaurantimonas aggregans]|uniref:ATP-binding cassette domain-containing protein n=1 Tax=Thermaurantimonas aggregans TaxID=2173829 RepID=UPI0023F45F3A|nr:ABC transporter ATP-binding protein [Thermaurantimonas aggregans]MCX8148516.1 ABC transporter ATP-binding protein/permease [Thermaurantimonas aggregans]
MADTPGNKPLQRFFKMLGNFRKEIYYIFLLGILAAIVNLSLPLGIQAIINLVMGGRVSNAWILLVVIVLIGVVLAGFFQILQMSLAEAIQQRIYIRAAYELGYRMPRWDYNYLIKEYPPELANRFFDVLTIQKGLPKILKEFISAFIQIVFGLLLLSFYHPFFIFFGLFLMIYLVLIFVYSGPKGMKSSLMESKYKYKTAFWLEEVARVLPSFKLAGGSDIINDKLHPIVENYIKYRKEHFKVLLFQFGNIVAFKTIITGGLLILGGILVINRDISLGQFVASEIIIIIILNSVEKLMLSLEVIYDVLTGTEKLGQVMDVPLEKYDGVDFSELENGKPGPIAISFNNISFNFDKTQKNKLSEINLEIKAGERVCLSGPNNSGKSVLLHIAAGLYTNYTGTVTFNGMPIQNIEPFSLRKRIGDNLSDQNIFHGTILENLIMGRDVELNHVISLCDRLGLTQFVKELPDGFDTEVFPNDRRIPKSFSKKILLIRSLLNNPGLLLLEDVLSELETGFCEAIAEYLTDRSHPYTLLAISNLYTFAKKCDKTVIIEKGRVIATGHIDDLIKDEHIRSMFRFTIEGLEP